MKLNEHIEIFNLLVLLRDELVSLNENDETIKGICHLIRDLYDYGDVRRIILKHYLRKHRTIKGWFRFRFKDSLYYWKIGKVKPRLRYLNRRIRIHAYNIIFRSYVNKFKHVDNLFLWL